MAFHPIRVKLREAYKDRLEELEAQEAAGRNRVATLREELEQALADCIAIRGAQQEMTSWISWIENDAQWDEEMEPVEPKENGDGEPA